jgi:hypothetical protein
MTRDRPHGDRLALNHRLFKFERRTFWRRFELRAATANFGIAIELLLGFADLPSNRLPLLWFIAKQAFNLRLFLLQLIMLAA